MSAMRVNGRARKSRTFSLLGTCGFLCITVIQVPKVVDLFQQLRSRQTHHAEFMSGATVLEPSAESVKTLNGIREQLERFEGSMIDAQQMPSVKSQLLEIAKDAKCQLRKSVSQTGSTEDWTGLAEEQEDSKTGFYREESPYQLEREHLNVSLEGSIEQTLTFLEQLRENKWLMQVSRIRFSRTEDGERRLATEVNLTFFKLIKRKIDQEQFVQWKNGPGPERMN